MVQKGGNGMARTQRLFVLYPVLCLFVFYFIRYLTESVCLCFFQTLCFLCTATGLSRPGTILVRGILIVLPPDDHLASAARARELALRQPSVRCCKSVARGRSQTSDQRGAKLAPSRNSELAGRKRIGSRAVDARCDPATYAREWSASCTIQQLFGMLQERSDA